jgi:hypothetical protein
MLSEAAILRGNHSPSESIEAFTICPPFVSILIHYPDYSFYIKPIYLHVEALVLPLYSMK